VLKLLLFVQAGDPIKTQNSIKFALLYSGFYDLL